MPRVVVPLRRTARWRCDAALPGVPATWTCQVFCESSIDEILMNKTRKHVSVTEGQVTHMHARKRTHADTPTRTRRASPGRIEVLEDDVPIEGLERSYRRQRLEVRSNVQQTIWQHATVATCNAAQSLQHGAPRLYPMCLATAHTGLIPPTSAPGLGSPRNISTGLASATFTPGLGSPPTTSAPGLGSPSATPAPGLGSPRPHLRRDF